MSVEKVKGFWCHKILPLVYDDSLSYYEVLCRLTAHLNSTIEYVNEIGGKVEELYAMYHELKDYVDHYFDNLDVQEEINNKLDQMAEDGTLTRILAEYMEIFVTPELYGAKGDGVTDDTQAIQDAIDSGVDVIFGKNTYLVTKANNPDAYPNADEPCLMVLNAHGQTINGNGGKVKVNAHGQGLIEVKNSSFITIKDLEVEGYGSFPKLDPNSGRGEKGGFKGGVGEGYYNTATGYEFGQFKNNSVDTSNYHGFGADASEVWGTFGNGYIGNCGSGIMVYDSSSNVTIENCKIHGFNYCGIEVGTRTAGGQATSNDIKLLNNTIFTCYNAGIFVQASTDVIVENNYIHHIGHPSAFPADYVYAYTHADPGYGIAVQHAYNNGYIISENINISNNIIENVIRKGVDMHAGVLCIISKNIVRNSYAYGIQCEALRDPAGLLKDIIISDNILRRVGQRGDGISVVSSYEDASVDRNVIISNNLIEYSNLLLTGSGIFVRYIPGLVVSGNLVNVSNAKYGLSVVACQNASVFGNRFKIANCDSYIFYVYACDAISASGNAFDVTGNTLTYDIEYSNAVDIHDNIFRVAANQIDTGHNTGLIYNNIVYNRSNVYQTGDTFDARVEL